MPESFKSYINLKPEDITILSESPKSNSMFRDDLPF